MDIMATLLWFLTVMVGEGGLLVSIKDTTPPTPRKNVIISKSRQHFLEKSRFPTKYTEQAERNGQITDKLRQSGYTVC